MADEMVVLQCEACSTRLKIRAVTARIMKDVKCPKCGRKVSTKSVAPGGEPAVAPVSAAAVSAPVPEAAPAPVPAPEAAPAPTAVSAPPVATPVTHIPQDSAELLAARARVSELEQEVQSLQARVAELTATARPSGVEAELAKARQEIAEQEHRLAELQKLWLEQEKEARMAQLVAQRAQQERKAVLDQMEAVLRSYHDAEIEAATDRINNLNVRLQNFLAQHNRPA